MSTTAARGIYLSSPESLSRLNPAMLMRLAPSTLNEISQSAASGELPTPDTLQSLIVKLFGPEHSRSEQLRIMLFTVPVVRQLTVAATPDDRRLNGSDITFGDIRSWLTWLDEMDPLCARMIDLHYFAGLSIRETAAAVSVSRRAVIRELRFARSWLTIKLQPT